MELLEVVIAHLAPRPIPTNVFEEAGEGGMEEFLEKSEQWKVWKQQRNSLLAFSLCCARFATPSIPKLWASLAIQGRVDMLHILKALERNPELGELVQSMYCLVDVISDEVTGGVATLAQKSSIRTFDSILQRTPNVEDILCGFPSDTNIQFYLPSLWVKAQRYAISKRLGDGQPVQGPGFALSKLKSLRIRRDLTTENYRCSFGSGTFSCEIVRLLPCFPELQTLEVCADSGVGVWQTSRIPEPFIDRRHATVDTTLPRPQYPPLYASAESTSPIDWPILSDPQYPALPWLKHLRLYGTYIREPELVGLVVACQGLETLVVRFESITNESEWDRLPKGKTLNQALADVAGTLRTLELISSVSGHFLTQPTSTNGRNNLDKRRLYCLPLLTRLENLSVDFLGLFGPVNYLRAEHTDVLDDMLPPSIRNFELTCDWDKVDNDDELYLTELEAVVHGLKKLCPVSRSLRKVALGTRPLEIYSGRSGGFTNPLADLAGYFEGFGVGFAYQCIKGKFGIDRGYFMDNTDRLRLASRPRVNSSLQNGL
jgi:hypothetical protein